MGEQPDKISVRFATGDDLAGLPLASMLEELQQFGGDPAVPENIEVYRALCRMGIERGDPVIVATTESGKLAGFICWVGMDLPFRQAKKTVMGLGTYVAPEFRRKKVGTMLREAAVAASRERGYERVLGSVHPTNEAAMRSVVRDGFRSAYIAVERDL